PLELQSPSFPCLLPLTGNMSTACCNRSLGICPVWKPHPKLSPFPPVPGGLGETSSTDSGGDGSAGTSVASAAPAACFGQRQEKKITDGLGRLRKRPQVRARRTAPRRSRLRGTCFGGHRSGPVPPSGLTGCS